MYPAGGLTPITSQPLPIFRYRVRILDQNTKKRRKGIAFNRLDSAQSWVNILESMDRECLKRWYRTGQGVRQRFSYWVEDLHENVR